MGDGLSCDESSKKAFTILNGNKSNHAMFILLFPYHYCLALGKKSVYHDYY